MSKRPRKKDGEIDQPSKLQRLKTPSEASKFNARVMKRLEKALAADPEVDLTIALPLNYVQRLVGRKSDASSKIYGLVRASVS
jgi:hypothetical protein